MTDRGHFPQRRHSSHVARARLGARRRAGQGHLSVCESATRPTKFCAFYTFSLRWCRGRAAIRGPLSCRRVGRWFEGRKDAVDQWRLSISECCPVETVPRDEGFTLQTTTCVSYPGTELPAGGEKVVFHFLCKIVGAKDGGLCVFFLFVFFANVQREKCGSRASPSLFNKI